MIRFSFIFLLLFLVACRAEKTKDSTAKKWGTAHSVDFNQELNAREDLKIKLFLAHHRELKMDSTVSESGLRFMRYFHGIGPDLAKVGQEAMIRVKIELLDGRVCYETAKDEIERVVIAKSEKETGIHEALQLMMKGDKAKLILPSYLGHGLLGDRMKIPPQSVLYIDLQLIDLN
jgi:FKBP-type peptidyl-prolyl cis-trans isomerase